MKKRSIHNPYKLQANGRVIEWRDEKPYRIYLECGMMLRLNSAGQYIPE